jgi:hypothetical protein
MVLEYRSFTKPTRSLQDMREISRTRNMKEMVFSYLKMGIDTGVISGMI